MRRESIKTMERNLPVVGLMRQIKGEHPFWGYRRMWAYLHFVKGLEINKKRVLRLMRCYDLLVKPNQNIKASRTPRRSKPRPDRPNQWWGIDMTKASLDQRDSEGTFKLATGEQTHQRREQPQDLVGAAVFLASAASDFITGQVLYVDGGTVML